MSVSPMQPVPLVAVLLAAYNGRSWLEEQLVSILQQISVNVTVFISIDQSNDGTYEWLAGFAASEARITLLSDKGRLGSSARNFFRLLHDVDVSEYDFVAFADQDDIWLPDKLNRAVHCLQEGYAGYSSDVTAFWPDGKKKIIRKSQPQRQWDFLFESPGPGCTFVMRSDFVNCLQLQVRECWQELQDFQYHDWFVYAFARSRGFIWRIDNWSGILYRQHGGNVVGANSGFRAFWSRANYVLRGRGFAQAILLTRLLGMHENSFVCKWSSRTRSGFLKLATHARQCRRHPREQLYFFILCLLSALLPSR